MNSVCKKRIKYDGNRVLKQVRREYRELSQWGITLILSLQLKPLFSATFSRQNTSKIQIKSKWRRQNPPF